jgi:outer membrane immunogenic protein
VKKFSVFAACVAAAWMAPGAVQAQTPTTRWDGLFVGLNFGLSTPNNSLRTTTYENAFGGLNFAQRLGFFPLTSASNDGVLGGVQAGYNQSIGWVVVGGETDFQLMSATTTVGSSPLIGGQLVSTSIQRSQSWFGTTRVKLGFAPMSYLLLYGTGGLAYGNPSLSVSTATNNVTPPFNSFATTSNVHFGWTAGFGAELSVADRWSIKAEYLYYDLGTNSVSNGYTFANSNMTTMVYENGTIFRGGLNFKF